MPSSIIQPRTAESVLWIDSSHQYDIMAPQNLAANPSTIMSINAVGQLTATAIIPLANLPTNLIENIMQVTTLPATGSELILYNFNDNLYRWVGGGINQYYLVPNDINGTITTAINTHAQAADHPYTDHPQSWTATQTFLADIAASAVRTNKWTDQANATTIAQYTGGTVVFYPPTSINNTLTVNVINSPTAAFGTLATSGLATLQGINTNNVACTALQSGNITCTGLGSSGNVVAAANIQGTTIIGQTTNISGQVNCATFQSSSDILVGGSIRTYGVLIADSGVVTSNQIQCNQVIVTGNIVTPYISATTGADFGGPVDVAGGAFSADNITSRGALSGTTLAVSGTSTLHAINSTGNLAVTGNANISGSLTAGTINLN